MIAKRTLGITVVVFGALLGSLLLTSFTTSQAAEDTLSPSQSTPHHMMSDTTSTVSVTETLSMNDMSQMLSMMMQMHNMMSVHHGMMAGMPVTSIIPMGDMSQMMPMMMDDSVPVTETMPLGDMSQMLSMMMPMMRHNMPMTETVTETMPVMTQMMGYRMQLMGLHIQMMGLQMQLMGQMHSSTGDVMPMMGIDHPQQQGMTKDEMAERQAMIAEAGRRVMPFDLDATTHIFEKTEQGGVQQVIVDDPNDTTAIEQIRAHLMEEAERFAEGDFHDPQMIHGAAMPGLHELMMGADQIAIEYSELPNGAQIRYTTENAALIEAIHRWFDAQVADHGPHAVEQ